MKVNFKHFFARIIKNGRKRRNWSQARLAEEAGVTEQFIVEVEGETRNAGINKLQQVADQLDLTLALAIDLYEQDTSDPCKPDEIAAQIQVQHGKVTEAIKSLEFRVAIVGKLTERLRVSIETEDRSSRKDGRKSKKSS